MPVIVIGADHPIGQAIVGRLTTSGGEVRAFVTDRDRGELMRSAGIKVAIGDVSDGSHVGGAAIGAHTAILVVPAAADGRDPAFAAVEEVPDVWARAMAGAGVTRVIAVGDDPVPLAGIPETASVSVTGRSPGEIAEAVAALEGADRLVFDQRGQE